ncbi:MAG: hypothetical protein ACU84Q_01610 [Gammaproteobacteria bacterium]
MSGKFPAKFSLLLVTFIAFRALVPIGYMLSLPASGDFELALHLCPTQNPWLDLSKLNAAPGIHSAAHHHAADDNKGVSVSSECRAWISSATFTFDVAIPVLPAHPSPVLPSPDFTVDIRDKATFHPRQARAPPIS